MCPVCEARVELDAAVVELDNEYCLWNQPTVPGFFQGLAWILTEAPRGMKDLAVECLASAFDMGGLPPMPPPSFGRLLIGPLVSTVATVSDQSDPLLPHYFFVGGLLFHDTQDADIADDIMRSLSC
jgi:hypothetical protein